MDRALRLLHLEDDVRDAELVRDMLDASGIACDITHVQTREEFVASLEKGGLDVILADYSLPSFDGMSALRIAAQRSPDVPFIFVSGTLGEELAIEALKLGATDYVLKERLSRVVSAVRGALREARHRAERKRAEEELRASEARFRTFVDHASDAFILHDEEGTVLDVNRQSCESLGYSRDDLIGMTAADFDPDVSPAMRQRLRERLRAGETVSFETRHRRKDGTVFPVEVRVRAFRDGGHLFYISLSRDITERRRAEAERVKLEERVRRAEKMEAIGRFASGIAHDFNTVLGGILAYGEMLFDEAAEGGPAKRYAQNVLTAATRGRDLVDQILGYTRSQSSKRRPTDVGRAVAETLELVRSSVPESMALHRSISDGPLLVMGDATQLHQIVMNLCSNAVHAMKPGGALRVAVVPLDVGADRALLQGTLRAGDYVRISVEDSGCGMDDATLARIFEPFFTTKEVGRGTGLGLALVYAIVSDYGGAIDVKTAPGEGSTFSIYLPMADARSLLPT